MKSSILDWLKSYSADGGEENQEYSSGRVTGMTLGVVVDTDDPLQMGRLRVFCSTLNDDPKSIGAIPWAAYISPFGGSIDNPAFSRGPEGSTTSGPVHYGFWAIPELGAHVLVGCIDGDPRRRYYIGTMNEHQETHTIMNGRWKWEGGNINGPLSSTDQPIQPLYDNLQFAYDGKTDSAEFKTRAADYQLSAIRDDVGQPPTRNKLSYLDQVYTSIAENEEDSWVKDKLGSHGYDWTGFRNLGGMFSSRVYGMSTPGFHSFIMDDRAFNNRVKIRSASGHMLLMDDTNERIYIATNKGDSWIEMDSNGNVDVFSNRRISMRAKKDINFTTDETFRVTAKKGVHLYAGDNNEQENLQSAPAAGEIRIQGENDIHIVTNANLRQYSLDKTIFEIGGDYCTSVGGSMFTQVQGDINLISNTGDLNVTVTGDFNNTVFGNLNSFVYGTSKLNSIGDSEILSFAGKLDLGALTGTLLKSMGGDVVVESAGRSSSGDGAVILLSPKSSAIISSKGAFLTSEDKIAMVTNGGFTVEQASVNPRPTIVPPFEQSDFGDDTTPDPSSCPQPASIDLSGLSGAKLAAAVAYNAGFRGDDLITMVAIARGESSWNPNAVGDEQLQSDLWGPSYGLWQVRSLQPDKFNPSASYLPDRYRDGSRLRDPSYNAEAAFAIYTTSKNRNEYQRFNQWTVYTEGTYKNFLAESKRAVYEVICGPLPASNSYRTVEEANFRMGSGIGGLIGIDIPKLPNIGDISSKFGGLAFNTNCSNSRAQASFSMVDGKIDISANSDISLSSISKGFGTSMFDGIVSQLSSISDTFTGLTDRLFAIFDGLGIDFGFDFTSFFNRLLSFDIVGSIMRHLDFSFTICIPTIPSIPETFFKPAAERIYNDALDGIYGGLFS